MLIEYIHGTESFLRSW